ncbi:MAG: ribonuclease P protein component [Synergistaceae bacterium]|jgi:ribonuclease P protein component|nr:ribonuclease P protein component [Synergistaceae bacterium]
MAEQARSFTYSPSVRLKNGWEFDAVFRTGRQQWGDLVRVYFVFKPGETTRVGVAVGKKIACSVQRSRGRRILRESLRRLLPWLKDGFWIVTSLREKALSEGARRVYEDISRSMKRAGLLRPEWRGADWDVDSPSGRHGDC